MNLYFEYCDYLKGIMLNGIVRNGIYSNRVMLNGIMRIWFYSKCDYEK